MHTLLIILLLLALILNFVVVGGIVFLYVTRPASRRNYNLGATSLSKILLIIGPVMLLAAIPAGLHAWHFSRTALHADGTVIELRERKDTESGSISYSPTFQFQDASGGQHTVASRVYSSPPEFRVGEKITVLYRGDAPDNAVIDSFWQLWGLPTMLAIGGFVLLSAGILSLFWPKLSLWFRGRIAQALPA